jgi:nucleotide-binding universal stress UspA family protein
MFTHLLVPLDGSELAEEALPLATAVAEKFNSKITLLTAVQYPVFIGNIGDGLDHSEMYANLSQSVENEAKMYLQAKQQALLAAGFHVDIYFMSGQPAAEAIICTAKERSVDTIVMSTHGRGGLLRWVYGSVADRVLRNATVPVLLARAAGAGQKAELEPPLNNADGVEIRTHFEPTNSGEIR